MYKSGLSYCAVTLYEIFNPDGSAFTGTHVSVSTPTSFTLATLVLSSSEPLPSELFMIRGTNAFNQTQEVQYKLVVCEVFPITPIAGKENLSYT